MSVCAGIGSRNTEPLHKIFWTKSPKKGELQHSAVVSDLFVLLNDRQNSVVLIGEIGFWTN